METDEQMKYWYKWDWVKKMNESEYFYPVKEYKTMKKYEIYGNVACIKPGEIYFVRHKKSYEIISDGIDEYTGFSLLNKEEQKLLEKIIKCNNLKY